MQSRGQTKFNCVNWTVPHKALSLTCQSRLGGRLYPFPDQEAIYIITR